MKLKFNFVFSNTPFIISLIFVFNICSNLTRPVFSRDIKNTNKLDNLKSENPLKSYYLLGAGDTIFIKFEGLNIFSGAYNVDNEGYINLPEIKRYFVQDKTIKELKVELERKYDEFVINPKIDISMFSYRPLDIYVYGEVRNPGLYSLEYKRKKVNSGQIGMNNSIESTDQVFSRELVSGAISPKLYEVLQASEGVTNNADLSRIQIVRKNSFSQGGGKIKAEINLLSLILEGDQSQNINLYDGDSIYIPKSNLVLKDQVLAISKTNLSPNIIQVYITGNVREKGRIELQKGTTLVQAIASTGGKKILTGKIEFVRFNNDGTVEKKYFRYNSNAKITSVKNPVLMSGDVINVRRTLLGNTAEVLKEVGNPVLSGYGLYNIFTK